MKANTKLLWGVFILSVCLISCYPQKEVLGRWPDGNPKVVRYHKRNNKLNERFVEYYDNGKKKYVRYWRNDLNDIYKTKAWYESGAKKLVGWRKYKDTARKYNLADSEYIFKGLCKGYAKEWYENGKVEFETITKKNMQTYNHYSDQGWYMKQEIIKIPRADGYDTVEIKIRIEPNGKRYSQKKTRDYIGSVLYGGE